MSAKDDVIEAVSGKLAGAQDNLYRFKMQARNMTGAQMEKEWGQSGRTFESMLKDAQAEVDRWKAALASIS